MSAPLPGAPGTYAVVFRSPGRGRLGVGRIGVLSLAPGWYVYVGSAFGPGGLAARLGRHLRRGARTRRWHVDYLAPRLVPREAWLTRDPVPREHLWARTLAGAPDAAHALVGFGASDCGCPSHLLHFASRPDLDVFRARLARRAPRHAAVERVR